MHQRSYLDVCAPPAAKAIAQAVAAPAVAGLGVRSPAATTFDADGAARALIDLAASCPNDAFASAIRPVFPSSDQRFDGEIGQGRIAILAMCLRHIAETGDGELATFLGDCLQQVPDCVAYLDDLIKFDVAVLNGDMPQGARWGLVVDLPQRRDVAGELGRWGICSVAHAVSSEGAK